MHNLVSTGSINPGSDRIHDDSRPPDWVRETAFGRWFLGTRVWRDHVLTPAIDQLRSLLPAEPPSSSHLLDLGCGEGHSIPLIADAFRPAEITAVDIDYRALTAAQDVVSASMQHLPQRTTLVRASAIRLPLQDRSVDIVFCHQLIHHLYRQQEALAEILRVMRPGGLLLFSESCRSFIESLPVQLLFRHPKGVQRDSADYIRMVRSVGFLVPSQQILTTRPWWSTYDLGLLKRLFPDQHRALQIQSPTELMLVAHRPS